MGRGAVRREDVHDAHAHAHARDDAPAIARRVAVTGARPHLPGVSEVMRLLKVSAALAVVGGFTLSARATLVAYEPFAYTAGVGALANQNGGTGWTTT